MWFVQGLKLKTYSISMICVQALLVSGQERTSAKPVPCELFCCLACDQNSWHEVTWLIILCKEDKFVFEHIKPSIHKFWYAILAFTIHLNNWFILFSHFSWFVVRAVFGCLLSISWSHLFVWPTCSTVVNQGEIVQQSITWNSQGICDIVIMVKKNSQKKCN